MFPEIYKELENESDRTGFVVKQCRMKAKLDNGLLRIARKADVKMWPRKWHNQRASRISELESRGFPQTAICAWMGNSVTVAKQHYFHPMDLDFKRAIE